MNNSDKEKILKSVFVDKQVEIRENLCWVKYPRTRIVFVIKENECELGLEISNGRPVPKSLAQFVYALFKNEKDIKICAILKQSFEEQKGTKYDPLSKDDFLLESNEINWNKIASLTWFSMYFEETDFEKVKNYVKMFKQKIDENMDEIKEILSEDSNQEQERLLMQSEEKNIAFFEHPAFYVAYKAMQENIDDGAVFLKEIGVWKNYIQYKPQNGLGEDWAWSSCHYEFRIDKGDLQVCFHCENTCPYQSKFADLLKNLTEGIFPKKWVHKNKSWIEYARIPLSDPDAGVKAADAMCNFYRNCGDKINKLIETCKSGVETVEDLFNQNESGGKSVKKNEEIALNTILYGPPGTGKTYNTMAYAVAICEEKNVSDIKKEMQNDYASVKKRYDALKEAGRIEFVTFHQSYGYEDFIEGIKPRVVDDGNDEDAAGLDYYLRPGIFKEFCEAAKENFTNSIRKSSDKDSFDESWNILINEINKSDDEKISVELKNKKTFLVGFNGNKTGLHAGGRRYFNKKQLRNIYEGQKGVPSGALDSYRRRIVEYMIKNCNLPPKKEKEIVNNGVNQNYVFVIDEINRGNISKVFGELITLIEPSKRLGEKEGMEVDLPCSGDEFGVPNNVYILGTMNTADRSIAMMDTALRRRFNFVEMMPDTSDSSPLNGKIVEDVDICEMLKTINKRIEYLYDREHTIGHAFFIGINDFADLASVFRNKVIPLLQEYFYDDYEKIRLVLGDDGKSEENQFVTKKTPEQNLFKGRDFDDENDDEKYIYEINQNAFELLESYKGII
jgi:5-methylcytosine-specific restriction protein B